MNKAPVSGNQAYNERYVYYMSRLHRKYMGNTTDPELIIRKTLHFLVEKESGRIVGASAKCDFAGPLDSNKFHMLMSPCFKKAVPEEYLKYLKYETNDNSLRGDRFGWQIAFNDDDDEYFKGSFRVVKDTKGDKVLSTLCEHIVQNTYLILKPLITEKIESKKQIWTQISDPVTVREVMKNPKDWEEGKDRYVTMLFTDLRGSSDYFSDKQPEVVCRVMREIHHRQMKAVWDNEGYLDKLIGDGLMAVFGMYDDHSEEEKREAAKRKNARRALRTAFTIMNQIKEFNKNRPFKKNESVGIGLGIHSGEVKAVLIGERNIHMSLTIYGDEVNRGSRYEDATKQVEHPIVVSESTIRLFSPSQISYREAKFTPKNSTIKWKAYKINSYQSPEGNIDYKTDVYKRFIWPPPSNSRKGFWMHK